MHQEYIVSNFYKFLKLYNIDEIKIKLKNKLEGLDIKGSFLLGNEGVNGSFSVKIEDFKRTVSIISSVFEKKFKFKSQFYHSHVFLRLKIKIKKEIVTIGKKSVQPSSVSGKYLSPEEWEQTINCEDVIVIDTRNHYESSIGSFVSSIKVIVTILENFHPGLIKIKINLKKRKLPCFVLAE